MNRLWPSFGTFRGSWWCGVFLLLQALGWWGLGAAIPSGWQTNLTEARRVAEVTNRPVLLYFTADWCGPCRQLAGTTLKDPSVQTQLEEFVPVALDLDAHSELAGQRQVSAIPTFLVLLADGTEVSRVTGYLDADRFLRFLTGALVASDVAKDRQEEFVRQREQIGSALKSGRVEEIKRAVPVLLKLCAERDVGRQEFARKQLEALATAAPRELIIGLEHELLAVRLAVANALREVPGARFEFDPWAPEAERREAVAQWRRSQGR
ncbi:MAG: thioredoxin family protein [Verrucomicrobia bacterium]|nr:thioredoxin family protein [Verrucomicrobiota bacterium]